MKTSRRTILPRLFQFASLRASRGYLFAVVAGAVLLTTLASIQWIRRDPLPAHWDITISGTAANLGEVSSFTESELASTFLSPDALTQAQTQVQQVTGRSLPEAFGNLAQTLVVKPVPATPSGHASVQIKYRGRSPDGPVLLRALADRFVRKRLEKPREEATQRVRAAESMLQSMQREEQATINEIQRLARETDRVRADVEQAELRVDEHLRKQDEARLEAQSQVNETSHATDENELQSGSLKKSLAELQSRRAKLLTQFTSRHPLVQDMDQRISEISRQLDAQRQTARPAVERREPLVANLSSADSAEELAASSAELQTLTRQLEDLKSKHTQKASILSGLQQDIQLHEAELEHARAELPKLPSGELTISEVTSPPVPWEAMGPFGLFFSLALGCILGGVASIRSYATDRRLISRSRIESVLALPIVGLIPSVEDAPLPEELSPKSRATGMRIASESVLGLFLLATVVAVLFCDGYSERITAQPLSAVAGSIQELVGGSSAHSPASSDL